jgi:HPt (histidine-containing phosphotransfer) domain-containing protein
MSQTPGNADDLIDDRVLRSCMEDFQPHEIRAILVTLREQSRELSGQAGLAEGAGAGAADLERIADTAHTVRSTCAVIGAIGVAARCSEVERAARSGDLAGVHAAIADLSERAERTAAALSGRVDGPGDVG